MMRCMTHDKQLRSRTTTRIDTAVLAQLRQKAGLTQLWLVEAVYRSAYKRSSSQASLKNTGLVFTRFRRHISTPVSDLLECQRAQVA